jgi:hypothetical protein
MNSGLIKRSFSLAGGRTSVALEQEFWSALVYIAASHHQTLTQLGAAAAQLCGCGAPRVIPGIVTPFLKLAVSSQATALTVCTFTI